MNKCKKRKLYEIKDPFDYGYGPYRIITVKAFNKKDAILQVLGAYGVNRLLFDLDCIRLKGRKNWGTFTY